MEFQSFLKLQFVVCQLLLQQAMFATWQIDDQFPSHAIETATITPVAPNRSS